MELGIRLLWLKRWSWVYLLCCGCLMSLGLLDVGRCYGQSAEAQQLLLNVEKLAQLKNILRDMKRGYEVLSGGYRAVRDIAQGNFSLHELFLDGLLLVSPEVRKYHRVADILSGQQRLVSEYRAALSAFRVSGLFGSEELSYLERVYGGLLSGSLEALEELAMVVTSSKLRMDDGERLAAIDRIFAGVEERLLFLRGFNAEAGQFLAQRKRERSDVDRSVRVMGIK